MTTSTQISEAHKISFTQDRAFGITLGKSKEISSYTTKIVPDSGAGYFFFKFTKIFLRKFIVFFAAIFLWMTSPVLAADSTVSMYNKSDAIKTAGQDDSKLSIIELRRKYPSTLISEKNKNDPDIKLSIEELRKKYPIALISKKDKINSSNQILSYSIDRVKSVFLNAEKNFLRRKKSEYNETTPNDVEVLNPQELKIIGDICEYLTSKPAPHLSNNQERLSLFIFSSKIQKHLYPFLSSEIQKCFFENDPYEDHN